MDVRLSLPNYMTSYYRQKHLYYHYHENIKSNLDILLTVHLSTIYSLFPT